MQRQGTINDLESVIKEKAKNHDHFLIALTGFGGAGKSTAAKNLADSLENAVVISLDEFITNRLADRTTVALKIE